MEDPALKKELEDEQVGISELVERGEHLVDATAREKYLKAKDAARQKMSKKEVMAAQKRLQEITLEFVKLLKSLPPALMQFEA